METIAFEFAASSAKEIIAFSTAVLTATATFAKDTFLAERRSLPVALGLSWLMYLVSILFGCWTLLALTGELASEAEDQNIYDFNVTFPAQLMVLAFLAGLFGTAVAGWQAVRQIVRRKKATPSGEASEDLSSDA